MNLLRPVPPPTAQLGQSPACGGEREWHVLMRRAALATAHDAHQHASALYLRALEIAAVPLQDSTLASDDEIAAYVVTSLNLADAHQACGDTAACLRRLQQVGQTVQGLLQTPGMPVIRHLVLSRHLLEVNASITAHSASRTCAGSSTPAPWFDGQLPPTSWGPRPQ